MVLWMVCDGVDVCGCVCNGMGLSDGVKKCLMCDACGVMVMN